MGIEELRKANPHILIRDADDPALAQYGRIIAPEPFSAMVELADRITEIDLSSNRYVASLAPLEACSGAGLLALRFGFAPMQIGYCNGASWKLNALEWHKSAEIDITVTDLVLFLGKRCDVRADGTYASSKLDCFYLEKRTVFELAPEVLHFAPCRVAETGFKSIIALPAGTNAALGPGEAAAAAHAADDIEARLLFMRNKWLVAHPERTILVERGAFAGIMGENIAISLP
ncbi:MAG: DUF4867 family protein [Rectinema sp.]